MRSASGFLAVLVAAVGCKSAPRPTSTELVAEHVADGRAATVHEAGAETDSLTGFERKVLDIRAEWQERLRAPETAVSLVDFATPEMARLRDLAAGDDFAESLAKGITLDQLLAGVFVRNPDLARARKELAATVEEYGQVTYLDTILRQYVSFLRTLNTRIGPPVVMDDVQKRFPFPGTLELKAAIVDHAVEAAQARYDAVLRDVVTETRIAYADHAFLGQSIRITEETLRYLRQLEVTIRGKLAAGSAPTSHVLQAQVEISALENDLVTLRQRSEVVRARLAALLDLPPATPLGEPAPQAPAGFPDGAETLYVRARAEQPDLRLARARAARMAAMIELAEQASYPELSAGLWVMEDPSLADREPFATKARTKPDPWFGTKEAYLREAREMERAAREAVRAASAGTLFRVKDAYVQLDTARRLHELLRDVQLAQAKQAYDDASAGYAADRVEFLNVIDALRRWLRFRLDCDRSLRDYHQAHARLEAAVGGPVPRGK